MAIAAMPVSPPLKAPFPWFGGKTLAAPLIWQGLGNVPNYVAPFAGSLAPELLRPHAAKIETVNEKDGYICNVWRALQFAPAEVASWCDWPPNEADQHAIHTWLVGQREEFTARLMGDPEYYDAKVAGRWLYGIACWIGGGWCSGKGAWQSVDGQLVHTGHHGVKRQRLHLGDAGRGVHRKLLHLGDAGRGVHRKLLHLGDAGRGVHRQLLHLGNAGQDHGLYAYFAALQARLRYMRVCCGDWRRVMGDSVTWKHGLTGILLDPPYAEDEDRDMGIYACDDGQLAHDVRAWCLVNGDNPLLRIILCGLDPAHDALLAYGWRKVQWKNHGGMGNQGQGRGRINTRRETLWLSPACLRLEQEQQLTLW